MLTGGPPEPHEELTLDELSSLFSWVDSPSAPYVGFAVWGPYGHLIAKKASMTGMVIGRKGELKNIEIYGPACFADWSSASTCAARAASCSARCP